MARPKARSILQDRCVNTTCYELCSKTLVDDATAKPNHSNNSRASILQYTVCACCARLAGTLSSIEKATQIRSMRPSAIYNRNTCFNNNVCLGVGGLFLLRFLINNRQLPEKKENHLVYHFDVLVVLVIVRRFHIPCSQHSLSLGLVPLFRINLTTKNMLNH